MAIHNPRVGVSHRNEPCRGSQDTEAEVSPSAKGKGFWMGSGSGEVRREMCRSLVSGAESAGQWVLSPEKLSAWYGRGFTNLHFFYN